MIYTDYVGDDIHALRDDIPLLHSFAMDKIKDLQTVSLLFLYVWDKSIFYRIEYSNTIVLFP